MNYAIGPVAVQSAPGAVHNGPTPAKRWGGDEGNPLFLGFQPSTALPTIPSLSLSLFPLPRRLVHLFLTRKTAGFCLSFPRLLQVFRQIFVLED